MGEPSKRKSRWPGAAIPIARHARGGIQIDTQHAPTIATHYLRGRKWEEIKAKGDDAVKEWIENNMKGKECLVVLVGSQTSSRRWVKYEVRRACERGMGVLGVNIHNLKDASGNQTTKGSSPFEGVTLGAKSITSYAKMYDPPYSTSKTVYDHISENLSDWVDNAIKLRK